MRKVDKPWGHEILWAHTPHYAAKIITIKAGHRLSLQYHKEKSESVYVLSGELFIARGEREKYITIGLPGESWHIPAGTIHRFSAPTSEVVLVEVSTPQLDDVVRLQDDYGRC